jgi:hypothetical protein
MSNASSSLTPRKLPSILPLESSSRKEIFNPYELTPNLVPEMLPELHVKKEFSSFIIVGLKLNINIRKLLSKIPLQYLNQTLAEIEDEKQLLIL